MLNDHEIQAHCLDILATTGPSPAVGLEMLDVTRQPALDLWNIGHLYTRTENYVLEALSQAVDWPKAWNHSFELYTSVFRVALRHRLPLYALNLPHALVRKVGFGGLEALSPEELRQIPNPIIMPHPVQRVSLKTIVKHHQRLAKDKGRPVFDTDRFFLVQTLWDTKMATEALALRYRLSRPIVVLAGARHIGHG
ncbi:hypothetical protein DSUL_60284 [Desulfovibrionales bacterium]